MNVEKLDGLVKQLISKVGNEGQTISNDLQGLEYYGAMLENNEITKEGLRKILLESEEYKTLKK